MTPCLCLSRSITTLRSAHSGLAPIIIETSSCTTRVLSPTGPPRGWRDHPSVVDSLCRGTLLRRSTICARLFRALTPFGRDGSGSEDQPHHQAQLSSAVRMALANLTALLKLVAIAFPYDGPYRRSPSQSWHLPNVGVPNFIRACFLHDTVFRLLVVALTLPITRRL